MGYSGNFIRRRRDWKRRASQMMSVLPGGGDAPAILQEANVPVQRWRNAVRCNWLLCALFLVGVGTMIRYNI